MHHLAFIYTEYYCFVMLSSGVMGAKMLWYPLTFMLSLFSLSAFCHIRVSQATNLLVFIQSACIDTHKTIQSAIINSSWSTTKFMDHTIPHQSIITQKMMFFCTHPNCKRNLWYFKTYWSFCYKKDVLFFPHISLRSHPRSPTLLCE